ncbi:45821_t:CDS:2, partial [Gigaspora margarita]
FSPWLFANIVTSLNVICRHSHFHKLYNHVLKFTLRNPYSLFDSADLFLLDEVVMICLLESDDLELEEIEIWNYLIKWGISKFLDDNISDWSDENILGWSDNHFVALKEAISRCIPLIRYHDIPKNYVEKQIKRYHLDSNAFTKSKNFTRKYDLTQSKIPDRILQFIFSVNPYFTLKKKPYFSKTSNSFIFSFTNPSNPVLSRIKTQRKNKAIYNDELHGPSFGQLDLCMKESNHWTSNWINYEHKITYSSQLIAEEYEVLAFYDYNPMIINIFLKILRM